MDFEISIHTFEMKKRIGDNNLLSNFFYQFVKFSALLSCKINVFDIFIIIDFFQIFFYREVLNSDRIELLGESVCVNHLKIIYAMS